MSGVLTEQAFIDAQSRGLQIRHTREDTYYNIIAVGKAKDDNIDEWLTSVTYGNDRDIYTRFLRNMGGFEIQGEDDVVRDDKPSFFTVVFESHNSGAFRAMKGILSKMMQSYSPDNPPVIGVVAASNENEILRLDMMETELEHINGEKSQALEIVHRHGLQYADLVALNKELNDD